MDRGVTPAQVRALHAGFNRLGYTRRSDRADRLITAGQILSWEQPPASFNDLTFGQAGYLLGWLRRAEAEIEAAGDPDGGASARVTPPPQVTPPAQTAGDADVAGLVAVIAVLLWLIPTVRQIRLHIGVFTGTRRIARWSGSAVAARQEDQP